MNFRNIIVLSVGLCFGGTAPSFAQYHPRPGHWHLKFVVKDDAGVRRELPYTLASYPATCARAGVELTEQTEQRDGYIWTDRDYIMMGDKSDQRPIRNELLEVKCIYIPWQQ